MLRKNKKRLLLDSSKRINNSSGKELKPERVDFGFKCGVSEHGIKLILLLHFIKFSYSNTLISVFPFKVLHLSVFIFSMSDL